MGSKMYPKTYDVPIMLDTVGLTYEDIAKLNPFYKEYNAFWDDSVDPMEMSYSSDELSSSSSLASLGPASDPYSPPFELATSPLFHNKEHPESSTPGSTKVTLRSGGQCRPTYDECHDQESSQIAILESDGSAQDQLSPLPERIGLSDSGALAFDPDEHFLGRTRSSHKKLFGANGWLGCTAEIETQSNKSKYKSLKGLGKKFVQQVEEIAGDVKAHSSQLSLSRRSKGVLESCVPISLDPTAQAKLYSEMEVMICVSANKFLLEQHDQGRISKDSIKKINNFWGSKNRPGVVEFQFDQATQRQLILFNIRTLHFNGESSTNPVLLHSNLHNWKAIVKEMSVRTFCSPDSVIRKHLHDIQKLLDMLGAPIATFLAFEELQVRTLSQMKEQRARAYLAEGGRKAPSRSSCSSF